VRLKKRTGNLKGYKLPCVPKAHFYSGKRGAFSDLKSHGSNAVCVNYYSPAGMKSALRFLIVPGIWA